MFSSFARTGSRWLPALAAAATLAAGCSDTSTLPTATPAADRGSVRMVPIRGIIHGYSYPIVPNSDCSGSYAGWNETGLDLAGRVSHLGRTTWSSEHCNKTVSLSPLIVDAASLSATMTAANGDQVRFSYALGGPGTSTVAVGGPRKEVDFTLTVAFTGGSGRFAGARGTGTFTCDRTTPIAGDPPLPAHTPAYANVYACTLDGMISRVRSSE
jgi:hypothetical protein